jgi:alpha 1,2-mannosyltransferase
LHYILSFSHEGYGRATSLSNIGQQLGVYQGSDAPYKTPVPEDYYNHEEWVSPSGRKANATIVMLARNGDLSGVISSMKQLEDRFNKKFRYPYTFLNEQPFSDEFKT